MSSKDGSSHKKKTSMSLGSASHRTSASYEETIVHGKKRKVWRSTGNNTANMMSPEAAANYLQQAAEAAAAAAAAAAAGGGESVQITLGPNGIAAHTTSPGGMESLHWMNPGYAAARAGGASGSSMGATGGVGVNNPLSGMGVNMNMSMNMNLSGGHPTSVSFGNLDLAALAKAGDLSALTCAAARNVTATSGSTASFPTSGFGTSTSIMGSSTLDPRKATPNMASTIPSASHCAAGNAKAGSGSGKESLPCSEAEMKALMSMFVEIMGMSMDTEKLGKSTAAKKRAAKAKKNGVNATSSSNNLFAFGDVKNGVWPDPAIAAATGDLDALNAHRYAYSDDEENEEDSLPDLDDMKEIQREQQKQQQSASVSKGDFKVKTGASSIPTNVNATPITGRSGIAPVEWESLEQVAIEDAMEAEERARKAAKRREKKNRKKEKARKEAAAKAAEAAAKKREKAILSWRSRVVSACQSNEVQKLKTLLEESPLTSHATSVATGNAIDGTPPPMMTMATMTPHLEFLLPHTIAKNRALAERGNEARTQLAHYVMNANLPLVFTTPLRTGRTALHTACLYGELDFVQHALARAQTWTQEGELSALPRTYLSTACQESGFAPIHYAVLSGSKVVLEVLLKAGADERTKSADTHTWKSSTGKGISPRELAETMSHGSQDKVLETHGLALQEALNHFSSSIDEKRKFKLVLERMVERLKSIEQHGYSPPPPEPEPMVVVEEELEVVEASTTAQGSINHNDSKDQEVVEARAPEDSYNSNVKKKKKKKKKGQQQNAESTASKDNAQANIDKSTAAEVAPRMEDPLVTALLGMGFTEKQITSAVKACGGTDRATADDLVVWILGDSAVEPSGPQEAITEPQREVVASKLTPEPAPVPQPVVSCKPKAKEVSNAAAEARAKGVAKKEEEARLKEQRIAAKREEKIRRNREWNNKAQARQKEEEQAKIAQAVAEVNRAATQRAAHAAAVQQQQQLHQQHVHQQAQQQHHAQVQQQTQQQHHQQVQQQAASVAAAGGPQVLTPASAFFAGGVAPSAAPTMIPPPPPHAPSPSMGMPPPPPGHYGVPLLPIHGHLKVEAQQATHHHGRKQGYENVFTPLPPHPPASMSKMVSSQSWEPPNNHAAIYSTDMSQYPLIADDSTVSSFGSGRVPVPPSFGATIPPGFRPTPAPQQTLPSPPEETASVASFEVEENPLGEMRATAKEFVPSFGSRPSSRNASSTFCHSSSLPMAPPPSIPPVTAESAATSRLRTFSAADITSAGSSSIQPNGLLGGVNRFSSPFLTAVPAHNGLTSALDRLAAGTAATEHHSPVPPSTASSVTGISSSEEPQLPAMLGLDKSSSDTNSAAAILENFTSGLASSSFDNSGAVSSIWSGISAADGSSGNTSTVGSLPLSGLPSLSLTSGGTNASALGPRADGMGSDKVLPGGLGSVGGWGSSNLGGGGNSSIW